MSAWKWTMVVLCLAAVGCSQLRGLFSPGGCSQAEDCQHYCSGGDCAGTVTCENGICTCGKGLIFCSNGQCLSGNECMAITSNACSTGQGGTECDAGITPHCPAGQTLCEGACGPQFSGQVCEGGTWTCPSNEQVCQGVCTDVMGSDPHNCGACGRPCDGVECCNGVCLDGCSTDAGSPDAGHRDAGTPDGGEPDAATPDAGEFDAGTVVGDQDSGPPDAGLICNGTDLLCGDQCVTDNAENCGVCGNKCGTMGGSCSGSQCQCPISGTQFAECVITLPGKPKNGCFGSTCDATSGCCVGACDSDAGICCAKPSSPCAKNSECNFTVCDDSPSPNLLCGSHGYCCVDTGGRCRLDSDCCAGACCGGMCAACCCNGHDALDAGDCCTGHHNDGTCYWSCQ